MAPNMKNYYEILGVPEYATLAQIKDAYLAMSQRLRRMKSIVSADGSTEYNSDLVLEAYNNLASPTRRQRHDLRLQHMRKSMQNNALSENKESATPSFLKLISYDESLYLEGIEYLDNGQNEHALVCFQRLLMHQKSNPSLFRLVAKAYMNLNSTSFAAKAMERAIELDPEDPENFLVMGAIHERANNLLEARRCFVQAYRLNPDLPEAKAQFERGSLVSERVNDRVKWMGKQLLPDQNARSLHYHEGILTWGMIARFLKKVLDKIRPLPVAYTFRYTGVW